LLAVRPLWQSCLMCSPLHCSLPHFQGDDAIRWYFGQGMLVTVVVTQRLLHFLVLAQTWNFCSGKPSPEALPKEHIPPHQIQICYFWWSQCHVRLDEWQSHVNCFWWCEMVRAVLLQRPLVMAAPCTDAVVRNLLITNNHCWRWPLVPQTQRLSFLCARCRPTVWCCIIN